MLFPNSRRVKAAANPRLSLCCCTQSSRRAAAAVECRAVSSEFQVRPLSLLRGPLDTYKGFFAAASITTTAVFRVGNSIPGHNTRPEKHAGDSSKSNAVAVDRASQSEAPPPPSKPAPPPPSEQNRRSPPTWWGKA